MHISLISFPVEKPLYFLPLHNLNSTTVHEVLSLEYLIDKNITIDIAFFNAVLGGEEILKQVQLYFQQGGNVSMRWLVVDLYDIPLALQYMKVGAAGILNTSCNKDKLQKIVKSIYDGQLYLNDGLTQVLALRQINRILKPFVQLTSREFDVFCLLAENYSIRMIADELSVTVKTAFNCQTQVKKKLQLNNQQEMIQLAKKSGLIF